MSRSDVRRGAANRSLVPPASACVHTGRTSGWCTSDRARRRPHRGPDQALPGGSGRRRRPRPRGVRGRPVRLPRSQRGRQEHDHPHAARAGLPDRRLGRGARPGRAPPQQRGPPRRGRADRGPWLLPPPVGAPEPPPVRRRREQRLPGHATPAHRGGHGARRPGRRGPPPGQGLLDGHAPAPRPGRGPPAPAPPADPRRAHQRPRPPGHPRAPDAVRRARPRGDDGVPVQPPPRRGRAHLHPGGHDGQRQARRPGPGGRAAGADGAAAHRVARRLRGRGLPAYPPHDGRVARPAPPAGAPQRGAGGGGQQHARRPGPARPRAGPGAADAGGRVPRAHGRRAVRAERGSAAVAAALACRPAGRRGSPVARGSVLEDGS